MDPLLGKLIWCNNKRCFPQTGTVKSRKKNIKKKDILNVEEKISEILK